MTLTSRRLLTAVVLALMALTVVLVVRSQRSDEAPTGEQTDATPLPNPGPVNPWRTAEPARPDPTAAVVGGVPAGMASDAAAAVAAAEATAASPAGR